VSEVGNGTLAAGNVHRALGLAEPTDQVRYRFDWTSPAVVSANLHDKDSLYPEQVKSHLVKGIDGSRWTELFPSEIARKLGGF
jgi:hypothetical protein